MFFVQGWVVDPYEHLFFNQPGEVLILSTHYAKIFKCGSDKKVFCYCDNGKKLKRRWLIIKITEDFQLNA